MIWHCATIRPTGAFGTAIRGDTLFGQICWALRHRLGNEKLNALLEGYVAGVPFLVVSDAFPAGYLPKPELPPAPNSDPLKRKMERKKRFVPVSAYCLPLEEALKQACEQPTFKPAIHSHNSISRTTSTTGGGFDPYQTEQLWPHNELRMNIHFVIDDDRFSLEILQTAVKDIGDFGYGRDASIGLGRFVVEDWNEGRPVSAPNANSWLTLAPTAPQDRTWDKRRCFFRPFTRFGRHGSDATTDQNVFKSPILLADTGAVLTPAVGLNDALFVGCGLGRNGLISRYDPGTVHQGFAPILPVMLGALA
jgi:CRISPR-associated protein Csm4